MARFAPHPDTFAGEHLQTPSDDAMYPSSNAPLVSVIMPSHNSSPFIGRGIASVLRQTLTDFELIVVDDCSSDDSVASVEAFSRNDARVRVIRRTTNGGGAEARNDGINAARGRYIAFLDADDSWQHDKLESQIAEMRSVGASLSYTDYRTIDEQTGKSVIRKAPATIGYHQLLHNNVIGCSTAIYDREQLGKRYFPKIRRRQDFGLWLAILRDIPLAHRCGGALTDYSVRRGSVSANKFTSALFTWRLYRSIERLSLPKAIYCFVHYALSGFVKSGWVARRLRSADSLG